MQILLNDRYQLIQTLGSGGFGETFLAEDTQMPSGRLCVVKQLRPIHNNSQIYQLVQERFHREAAILEDLGGSIDQIPNLYAYFQTNGKFCLVQEWIAGDTLTGRIQKQGLFNEIDVNQILVSLLQILEHVHAKKIIHRDIKPDNIILRQRDGKPVLIDFGAVRETMGTTINSQGNSISSIVIGTPGYMSNEQAAGRAVYGSDIYSLGMTAIYLLTGKQPQELELDSHTGEIIWQKYALNLSPKMRTVLEKAIFSHPRDRFTKASAMLQELQVHTVASVHKNSFSEPALTLLSPAIAEHTIPLSPKNWQQPINQVNQGRGQKESLIGSLVISSLIGTSIIVGLALNKQPQKVIQAPLTQKSVAADFLKDKETASSNQQLLASQQAAEKTVSDYYSAINNQQYRTAWHYLSLQHQNNTQSHPNGFNSFTEWWEKVAQVQIQQLTSKKTSNTTATVNLQLRYLTKSGRKIPQFLRFFLVWDTSSQQWLINQIEKI